MSYRQSQSTVVEVQPSDYIAVEEQGVPQKHRRRISPILSNCMLGLLAILAICFGGVHSPVSNIAHTSTLILSIYLIAFQSSLLSNRISQSSTLKYTLYCLIAIVSYSVVQALVFANIHQDYPVVGKTSWLVAPLSYIETLSGLLFFVTSFFIFSILATEKRHYRKISNGIIGCSLVISMIALGHWLYDNGKLFGIFEPNIVFSSNRARWPFVNSNHLPAFLFPGFFLCIARLFSAFQPKEDLVKKTSLRQSLSSLRSVETYYSNAFLGCAFVSITLAILAAQSRGALLALAVGVFLLFTLESWWKKGIQPLRLVKSKEKRRRKSSGESNRRRKRNSEEMFNAIYERLRQLRRPLMVAALVMCIYFFLQGTGERILQERIDYAIAYSMTDLRWDMLTSNMNLIWENLIFGIGLGAWQDSIPSFYTSKLADISPVYLHSDPVQLFTELGLVGSLPIIFILGALARDLIRRISRQANLVTYNTIALTSALLATITAACFDFPFRIPAISFCFAATLALLVQDLKDPDGATSNE